MHVPPQHPEEDQERRELGIALWPKGTPEEHGVATALVASEHGVLERSVADAGVGRGQVGPRRRPGQSGDQEGAGIIEALL
eukprot:9422558-Alexandrium_andersonii.AAC.1